MKKTILKKFAILAAALTMITTSMGVTLACEEEPTNVEQIQQVDDEQTTYSVDLWLQDDLIENCNMPNTAVAGQDYVGTIEKWGGARTSYFGVNILVGGKSLKKNEDYTVNIDGNLLTLKIFGNKINGDIHIFVNILN